jgi:AcrR family transcriptional regulator
MSAVARATGISRQALYLHFPDRSALLLAVVEHVDSREGLGAAVAEVEAAVDGRWTTTEAAALVWELVSFRVWDDLVNEAGMTPERYAEIATTAVLATLAAPVRRARR